MRPIQRSGGRIPMECGHVCGCIFYRAIFPNGNSSIKEAIENIINDIFKKIYTFKGQKDNKKTKQQRKDKKTRQKDNANLEIKKILLIFDKEIKFDSFQRILMDFNSLQISKRKKLF